MSDSYDECIILYVHIRAPVHACVKCHNVQLYTQSACIKWHVPFNNMGLVYTQCYGPFNYAHVHSTVSCVVPIEYCLLTMNN